MKETKICYRPTFFLGLCIIILNIFLTNYCHYYLFYIFPRQRSLAGTYCHTCFRSPSLALKGARLPIITHTCHLLYAHQCFIGLTCTPSRFDCLSYICLFLCFIPVSVLLSLCFSCPDTILSSSIICPYTFRLKGQAVLGRLSFVI